MSLIVASCIIALVGLTIIGGVINARIYNNLHGMDQEMIYTTKDLSRQEIDKSNESFLFAAYCALIVVWLKYKNGDGKLVLLNYLLGIISLLIINYLIM